MSNKRVSADYSPYSFLNDNQFVGSPIHSTHLKPNNSAKELIFLMKISLALKEIDIDDEDERNYSESSDDSSFRSENTFSSI